MHMIYLLYCQKRNCTAVCCVFLLCAHMKCIKWIVQGLTTVQNRSPIQFVFQNKAISRHFFAALLCGTLMQGTAMHCDTASKSCINIKRRWFLLGRTKEESRLLLSSFFSSWLVSHSCCSVFCSVLFKHFNDSIGVIGAKPESPRFSHRFVMRLLF